MKRGRDRVVTVLIALALAIVTGVFFTPFCGLLHRCGCRPLGWGAESLCNVNNPSGPHCPWCEYPALAGSVFVAVVVVELGVFRALRRREVGLLKSVVGALATMPVTGVMAGALAWAPTDYPHFIVLDLRAKLALPRGPIACCKTRVGVAAGGCCSPTHSSSR